MLSRIESPSNVRDSGCICRKQVERLQCFLHCLMLFERSGLDGRDGKGRDVKEGNEIHK